MDFRFQEEMEEIKKAMKSVLLSSHILSDADRVVDKLAIIRRVETVENGSLDELRHLMRSTIIMIAEKDIEQMATVNGVFDFKQNKNQATFSADPQFLNDILRQASKLEVRKFESVPPTLENLFLRHYERKTF